MVSLYNLTSTMGKQGSLCRPQFKKKPQRMLTHKGFHNKQTESIIESITYTTLSSTPVRLRSLDEIYATCNYCVVEPETYEEAEKDKAWKKAIKEELEMIEKNDTWELVNQPSDKPVIGVKLVYKVKLNLDGSMQKNKARLVAKGYSQKPGVDFNETFAPIAMLNTIKTLIALATKKG